MSFFNQPLSLKYQQLDHKENEKRRPKMYKCQQINRGKNKEKRPKVYKYQQIDTSEDKKRQNLTSYNSKNIFSFFF